MSGGKFASMTASLLARKGDAVPSSFPDASRLAKAGWTSFNPAPPPPRHFDKLDNLFSIPPTDMRTAERGAHARRDSAATQDLRLRPMEGMVVEKAELSKQLETKAAEPAQIDKPRRLFINLTPQEYERLGIVAVKHDSTRHQLLRDAMEAFLEKASKDIGKDCACLGGGETCKGACA